MSGKAHMAEGIPGKDGPLYRQALGLPLNAACNLEQAITRTAEQSHIVALAERDALAAQVEALTAQRDEAVRLLNDWQAWASGFLIYGKPMPVPPHATTELLRGVRR